MGGWEWRMITVLSDVRSRKSIPKKENATIVSQVNTKKEKDVTIMSQSPTVGKFFGVVLHPPECGAEYEFR